MTLDLSARFPQAFYARDPLEVAPDLLGQVLVHWHPQRGLLAGRIVEVEAYRDEDDRACHAAKGRTKRTDVMYGAPGRAYVYLIYGMYDMFNVVTWPEGRPAAVLVRGLEPAIGIERTVKTNGPGKLARALGVDRTHNRADLRGDTLFLSPGEPVEPSSVQTSPRIGVDYAGEWAERPWRYSLAGNTFVSKRPRAAQGG